MKNTEKKGKYISANTTTILVITYVFMHHFKRTQIVSFTYFNW